MKKVYVAQNPAEAHLVKGMLESNGIRAEVQGEALWGTRGETPVTPETLPEVWVLDDDEEEEAVRLVEEYAS
jgi:Putative prokaryotic signal transducing protein